MISWVLPYAALWFALVDYRLCLVDQSEVSNLLLFWPVLFITCHAFDHKSFFVECTTTRLALLSSADAPSEIDRWAESRRYMYDDIEPRATAEECGPQVKLSLQQALAHSVCHWDGLEPWYKLVWPPALLLQIYNRRNRAKCQLLMLQCKVCELLAEPWGYFQWTFRIGHLHIMLFLFICDRTLQFRSDIQIF